MNVRFFFSGHECGVGMRLRELAAAVAPPGLKGGRPRVRDVGRGHAKETRLRKTLSAESALRKQVSFWRLFR